MAERRFERLDLDGVVVDIVVADGVITELHQHEPGTAAIGVVLPTSSHVHLRIAGVDAAAIERVRAVARRAACLGAGSITVHAPGATASDRDGLTALAALRAELAPLVDVEIAAHVDTSVAAIDLPPLVAAGATALSATLDGARADHLALLLAAGAEQRLPLHLDVDVRADLPADSLRMLLPALDDAPEHARVIAHHLAGLETDPDAAALIEQIGHPALRVVVYPDNLTRTYPARGIGRFPDLLAAGIQPHVGIQLHDQRTLSDAWVDPLAAARLLYHAAAFVDDAGIELVLDALRRSPYTLLAVGAPATFTVVAAADQRAALRLPTSHRTVVRSGRVVMRHAVSSSQ